MRISILVAALARFYVVRARRRVIHELLAVFGIAIGVALVFATLVANTTLSSAMESLTKGIIGETVSLQMSARGPQGFDERLLAKVVSTPGVRDAAPVLEARVNVVGPRGRKSVLLIGADPRLARIGGPLVRPFGAINAQAADAIGQREIVAVPAAIARQLGIALGAPMRLETEDRAVRVPIGLSLDPQDVGPLANSPVVIAPLPYAQNISDLEGRVSRIFIRTAPGQRRVLARQLRELDAGAFNVRSATADIDVFEAAAYPTMQSTTLFSVLAALVGFLFGLSAVLLTTPYRQDLIRQLRFSGFSRRQIRQVLFIDAMALGVAGTVLGLALGDLVSKYMFDDIPDYLAFTFSIGEQRTITWTSIAGAGAAGVLAAFVAIFVPLRGALPRRGPSLVPAATSPDRTWLIVFGAASSLLVATVVVALVPDLALVGLVALTVALILSLPLLLRVGAALLARTVQSMTSPALPLAAVELRSRSREIRTIAVAATGALAVFATVSITGARVDLQRGLDASTRDTVGNADVWVTFPDAPNVLATTPFQDPRTVAARLRGLPEIEAVRTYRGSLLDVEDHRAWVLAPPADSRHPVPPSQIRHGDLQTATRMLRQGGAVVLSEAIADAEGVAVGDRVSLPVPNPRPLRVAAITTNLGWSPGSIVLNADDYATAWQTDAASALHVDLTAGASAAIAKRRIQRALGTGRPFKVETRAERRAAHYAASRNGLTRLTQIAILVLVAAILAMTTAMAGMIWQRRPLFARLKVQGFSNTTLWRALIVENLIVLGAGCGAGAVAGLYGQLILSRALEAITGFPVAYSPAFLVAGAVLAVVILVALGMLAIPGRIAVGVEATLGASRRTAIAPAGEMAPARD